MGFEILPFEVQASIFKELLPSDLVKIWHDVPEMKQFITSGMLKIVTTSVNEMKLKYDFPDEFYFQYECESDSDEQRNQADLEFQQTFKGFNGSILVENLNKRNYRAHGLNVELFKPYIHEITWYCEDKYHGKVATFEDIIENSGGNLKQLTVENTGGDNFVLDVLPSSTSSRKVLQYSGVKRAEINDFKGHTLSEISTLIPDLEKLSIESKYWYTDTISNYKIKQGHSPFPEIDEHSVTSFNRLKELKIDGYHNDSYKISNLYLPNLQQFTLRDCFIHSIKNLKAPNLKRFGIHRSALFEISDLELHSLNALSINLRSKQEPTTGNPYAYQFILQDIKSNSLKEFSLNSSTTISKISGLYTPALKSATIVCFTGLSSSPGAYLDCEENSGLFNDCDNIEYLRLSGCTGILKHHKEYQSVKTLYISGAGYYENDERIRFDDFIVRSTFPNLENLEMYNLVLDEHEITKQILTQPSQLNKLELMNCTGFKIDQLSHHENLKSLLIENRSFEPFQNINMPSLTELEIGFTESDFVMEDCTFKNIQSLSISLGYNYSEPGTTTFMNNILPKLETLTLGDHKVMNHITTKPYPALRNLTIDHAYSLEITPSETLTNLNLSRNSMVMDLDIGEYEDLPNLDYYVEPRGYSFFR
ncbi:Toll-like receptor 13 [Wickerhamomyces ciferrii]|uniref:Toll-like receptor 13 n=1 Tax=Wickerhamomyces ciferrii (strain ATCC 14091 / BCRC 22168 / CBS 111 / JCM 3599 / NBRC 0793 / NRRL Y-1031 F-60-10) TaxID=1206466 RepID=K0KE22_WICCF|nr:Toll-like receptor 13 [Wickerhamomyces ciferrii]CCH41171.1 Toll-like receptor 13 [Wickerhamomyces ciferrii]